VHWGVRLSYSPSIESFPCALFNHLKRGGLVLSVLAGAYGAPALPMHDGVIVRKSDQDAARETMWLAYKGAGHTSRPEIKIEF